MKITNFQINSEIRNIILGIDEAGRGSVIGPLVIGTVIINKNLIEEYTKEGITDSKLISKSKREILKDYIEKTALKSNAIELSAKIIDNAVLDKTDNLNLLELRTMATIIMENIVSEVFIDAISTPKYCTSELTRLLKKEQNIKIATISDDTLKIQRQFNQKKYVTNIIAQNKADLTFKVVSAASIIAKTRRDLSIRNIEKEYSLKDGILASGYANNQLNEFLTTYKKEIKKKEFPFIRYSWNWTPLQKIIQKRRTQKKLSI